MARFVPMHKFKAKPCPFCRRGKPEELAQCYTVAKGYRVECGRLTQCNAAGPFRATALGALHAWNRAAR